MPASSIRKYILAMIAKMEMIVVTNSIALMAFLLPLSGIAMSFEDQGSGGNCDTCAWIAASREITSSTPADFKKFVSNHDKYTNIIYLSSSGGSVAAAMQLGREFRKLGITTVVGESIKTPGERFPDIKRGACVSACVLAFAGGKSRYYRSKFGFEYGADKNILGLYQFYTDARSEDRNMTAQAAKALGMESAQMAMSVQMAYLAEMGVDPLLLALASAIRRGDLYTLTEAEALHFKLAMPQYQQPDWQMKFQTGSYCRGIWFI